MGGVPLMSVLRLDGLFANTKRRGPTGSRVRFPRRDDAHRAEHATGADTRVLSCLFETLWHI
jgi:hypothetical protein